MIFDDEMKILEKKIVGFNNTIDNFKTQNSVDELVLREQLNDILGQFEVCLKRTRICEHDGQFISAIKYANNVKKHSQSLFNYTISTLALYPSDDLYPADDLFPSDFRIWWNELPLDNNMYKHQYNCYNKGLLNKDLKETINETFYIIRKGYKKLII